MLSAEQLHRRGVVAINAGRVRVARPLLERALERDPDPDLRARIEVSLAYVAAETGDPAHAIDLCTAALSRSGLSRQTRGIGQSQRALLLMRAGDTTGALTSFAAAIDALGGLADELGRAHLNRGDVYLQQGQPQAAGQDFRAAQLQFGLAGLPVEAAKAQHNLGYACFLQGDLVSALRDMEAASVHFAEDSPVLQAIAEQDRAEVLLAAGLLSEGTEVLRLAARAYGARGLRQRQGEAELTLSRSLVTHRPAEALAAAREAARRFAVVGTSNWHVRAEAAVLVAEVELGRKGPHILARGTALIEELKSQGLDWGADSVRLHTARVMLRRGDQESARRRLARVRVTAEAPLSLRLLACDVRAELAMSRGRRAVALGHVREGLAELHAWQSSFGSLDLQTMVVGNGVRLASLGLTLAVQSGSPAVLFEWSERARMLASRIQPVRVPQDEQMSADLAQLRLLAAREDGARVPQPRQALSEEIRSRVRERAWQLRGSGSVAEPAPLEVLHTGLGTDTALVAWVVTPDRVTGLVVTGESETAHDVGSRTELSALLDGLLPDLDVAASDLPNPLARTVRAQLAGRLEDLDALLVAPLLERIGGRRVVLTPSGVLAGTPWTLLPGFVGRPVTVAQSATSWLSRSAPLELVRAGFVAGPRVARAEAEVHDAAHRWQGSVELRGDLATADAVATLAARVDVLHIAAHGRHSADNPLFSGVELVGGPWFGYDIDQLEKVPQVVLLSACEVGRSSVRYGEELIGMTAAWLHAGVRCVIASSAAVSDDAAHDALTAVHAGLARGLDPAAALAGAVPAVSADQPPAPFVCFG